jgi:hypothetical protein
MEFYLSVLNDKVKLPHENPAIGIIICKSKNRTIVEYSLKTATLPIEVATYQTTSSLPAEYRTLLPSANVISQKLMQFLNDIEIDERLEEKKWHHSIRLQSINIYKRC